MKHGVLVISPDAALSQHLLRSLAALGYDGARAQTWADVDARIDALAPDVVLLDAALAGPGHEARLAALASQRPTVLIAHADTVDAVLTAMRAGACCHLLPPINTEALELKIRQAIDARRMEAGAATDEATEWVHWMPDLIGDSRTVADLRSRIIDVGRGDGPVLISGEPGVGKTMVAREVHRASRRASARFAAVDCRSIEPTALGARLFGRHPEAGAESGEGAKYGLVEATAGGTLFLAGVDAIGPPVQSALLALLDTGRYCRVGEQVRNRRSDVRIIAATGRELPRLVRDREFSAELYYRLSEAVVDMPPLRTHPEDIPTLVAYFARRSVGGRPPPAFDATAVLRLQEQPWPGNERELYSVVIRAMLLAHDGGVVLPEHLALPGVQPLDGTPASIIDDEPTLDLIARRYMVMLLERYAGNRRRVAEVLGVSERTAYRMLDRFGLKNG